MSATAGATSTQPAASSAEQHQGARPRLHLLGIRHHGPGSAHSVVRALDAIRPDAVLVELPADSARVLRWVHDDELVPPVALLGYLPRDVSKAAFWPLAEFSPEWQAIQWALDHGIEPQPIDVPIGWALGTGRAPGDAERLSPAGTDDPLILDPLGALAAAAGEPDTERWWDDVVEHRGDGAPAFAAVAEAMRALRGDTPASGPEAVREAHMRRAIRKALGAVDIVAVVCGAWHVPALDPDTATSTADAGLLRGAPRIKASITWVPWSDHRLRHRSGYTAGVANPGWYRHVFRHPGTAGVARFFVDAAAALRRNGLAASPDHLIGATRLADGLAVLRGRPRAGLDEVLDAASAVMSLTASGAVAEVLGELTVGAAIGSVPPAAPQVPLARDVAAAQRAARLPPRAESKQIELDVRTPNGLRRSRLLHRLGLLGVGWGVLDEQGGGRSTFRETWTVRWDPVMSVRLVECAGYGTTLVAAASAAAIERVSASIRLPQAAALVDDTLRADLADAVRASAVRLGELAARAPDVSDLIDAVVPLSTTLRYGDVRKTDSDALRTVVDELVVRILAGLGRMCRHLDDDAAAATIERLSGLQGALAMLDHPARGDKLPGELAKLADARSVHGLVRGRATRLLHDGATWDAGEVSQRVGRALTPGTPAADGARFIEGFLAGSGTVLLHDAELLSIIDAWISAMSHDGFTDAVALLRRTFGAFEPAERRQLGTVVTGGRRRHAPTIAPDLDARRALAGLDTVRAMLGLPPSPPPPERFPQGKSGRYARNPQWKSEGGGG